MKKFIDLYAGLGGASEAFIDDWDVIRIDNNPLLSDVPNMIMMDLLNAWYLIKSDVPGLLLVDDKYIKPDLLWASFPCLEFSQAYLAPGPKSIREKGTWTPHQGLKYAEKTKEDIRILRPKTWVVENVIGSIKWLKPIFGEPRQIIGPFVLWGNFPRMNLRDFKHSKYENDTHSSDPLRANKRALIPLEISKALKDAVENQTTLDKWL